VARELGTFLLGADAGPAFGDDDSPLPHAVLPLAPDPSGPPPAVHQVAPPRTGPGASVPEERLHPHTGARTPVWVGVALLLALAVVLAVLVAQVGTGVLPTFTDDDPAPRSAPDPRATTEADTGPLRIASVTDFDPQGTDGGENPDEAAAAHDADASTAWTTSTYFGASTLGNLKDGVGLLVDLGREQDVSRADLTLLGGPTSLTVYAAPGAASAPTVVDDLTALGATRTAAAEPDEVVQASIEADEPVETRWLVVWLTDLPPDGAGDFEGSIAELAVVG
jgi:putative peptidoglycan lipid II flippase